MDQKKRNPLVAGLLTVLSPGAGFLYNGFLFWAIAVTLGYYLFELLCLWFKAYESFHSAVSVIVLSFGSWVYFIAHNISKARKIESVFLKPFQRWYSYLLFTTISIGLSFVFDGCSDVEEYSSGTGGMSPAVEPGERVVVGLSYYRNREITQGDIVVFPNPKDPEAIYMKRCIALGGQTVEIRDGLVYVDDKRSLPQLPLKRSNLSTLSSVFKDPRIVPPDAGNEDQYGPVAVPEGKLFVLGDYRDNSFDSRFWGFVDQRAVMGRALYIWWSSDLTRIGKKLN